MTCAELERCLDEDRTIDTPEAAAHLATCAECRRAVERWRAVRSELRSMASEPDPPFLHTRVMAHVRAEGQRAPGRTFWLLRPVWAAPALAVLFIGVVAGLGVWRAQRETPSAPAAEVAEVVVAQGARPHAEASASEPPTFLKKDAPLQRERRVAPSAAPGRLELDSRSSGDAAGGAATPQAINEGFAPEPRPPATPAAPQPSGVSAASAAPPPARKAAAAGHDEAKTRASESAPGPSSQVEEALPQEAPRDAERQDVAVGVRCALIPIEGTPGDVRRLTLPASWAPPASVGWVLDVTPEGSVHPSLRVEKEQAKEQDDAVRALGYLADEKSKTERAADGAAPASSLASALRSAHLPPGRYRLIRAH
jgi:negative regulator of sigma E activity